MSRTATALEFFKPDMICMPACNIKVYRQLSCAICRDAAHTFLNLELGSEQQAAAQIKRLAMLLTQQKLALQQAFTQMEQPRKQGLQPMQLVSGFTLHACHQMLPYASVVRVLSMNCRGAVSYSNNATCTRPTDMCSCHCCHTCCCDAGYASD